MHITDILVRPVVTEKSNELISDNKYTFFVNKDANKIQIKEAVEKMFKVDVEKVRTLIVKPKKRRVGRHQGFTSTKKKAIVTLKDGQTIDKFDN